jgi:hypothetical protein
MKTDISIKISIILMMFLLISCTKKFMFEKQRQYHLEKQKHLKKTTYNENIKINYDLLINNSSATKKENRRYYFSNKGDDNNDGLSEVSSFKTIDKLNKLTLMPGDSILFMSGDKFIGQINIRQSGTEENRIYLGAYGKGKKPIICGATVRNNWNKVDDNVWKTFRNKLESPYWTVCVFDEIRGEIVYDINQLKSENRYYIDPTSDNIYIYSTRNPNNRRIEVSLYQDGINIRNQSNIHIEDLEFQYYGYSGIMMREPQEMGNNIINRCYFYFNRMNGVTFLNGHNNNYVLNSVAKYNGNGFYSIRSHNNVFYKDTIEFNQRFSAEGLFTDAHGIGLFRSGGCIIEYCYANANFGGAVGFDPDADQNAGAFSGTIRYNYFKSAQNRSACIGIQDLAKDSDLFIYYNLIENSSKINSNGFGIYSGFEIEGNLYVYNNTIIQKGSSHRAVAFRYADNVHFINNLVYCEQEEGTILEVGITGIINANNNLYYKPKGPLIKSFRKDFNSIANWIRYSKIDLNSLTKNPLLTDRYKLQKNSPAINNGTSVGLTHDKEGVNISDFPDIGCYEFN